MTEQEYERLEKFAAEGEDEPRAGQLRALVYSLKEAEDNVQWMREREAMRKDADAVMADHLRTAEDLQRKVFDQLGRAIRERGDALQERNEWKNAGEIAIRTINPNQHALTPKYLRLLVQWQEDAVQQLRAERDSAVKRAEEAERRARTEYEDKLNRVAALVVERDNLKLDLAGAREELAKQKKLAVAKVDKEEALRAAATGLFRAWQMLSAINDGEPSADRKKAAEDASEAALKAYAALREPEVAGQDGDGR